MSGKKCSVFVPCKLLRKGNIEIYLVFAAEIGTVERVKVETILDWQLGPEGIPLQGVPSSR
ncbi:hypothetical protein [Rubidibacter lacunae]|uniref:hypothetical protein n=1 Tax=Rubidibacter lacunae TaxID=582514 RepID=UPI0012EBB843|nr:hypothetical protein [Rubidibacter lacunae]